MATILPLEMETEILLLLPAKTLQRCSSVCKSWHSLITSSSFISSYNDYSSSNSKFLLLKHPHPVPLLPSYLTSIHFSLFNDSLTELSTIKVPQELPTDQECDTIRRRPTRVELVTSNSINGVLCFLVYMGFFSGIDVDCDLFLWNPSTSEKVKIPSSKFTGLFSGSPMLKFYCGFGFGCEDYKVVRIVYMDDAHYTVEIYSLRENCWKCLGMDFCSGILSNTLWTNSTCTFVNGVGYWGCHSSERKDRFFVLEFDFEKECFKGMEVPVECVNGGETRYQSLWVYHGSLAISVLRFGEFDSCITRHYIWAMKVDKDSGTHQWNKLFNIDLEGGPRRPMVTLTNGELLLLGEVDGEHTLYDPESEEIKRIDIFDVEAVVPYVESLVSLSQLMLK